MPSYDSLEVAELQAHRAAMRDLGRLARSFYDAMTDNGFAPEHAVYLTDGYLGRLDTEAPGS